MERLRQAYREERLARYEQVVALHQLGMSQAAIAKRVGMGQSTVGNWLAAGAYPETTRGPSMSRIDPYLPYLFQRWESGCHTMVRLHEELVAAPELHTKHVHLQSRSSFRAQLKLLVTERFGDHLAGLSAFRRSEACSKARPARLCQNCVKTLSVLAVRVSFRAKSRCPKLL